MKFRVAARRKMWQFLTNYVSFQKNYRHSIRRHRLLEFFNILPPLKRRGLAKRSYCCVGFLS